MAAHGCIAHRFNFSHSGMTEAVETFARPDLFERDTWNRQVADLCTVLADINDGVLAGTGLPLVLFGHSRGGVAVLLTLGRHAADPTFPAVAGAITAATPSTCNSLTAEEQERLLDAGFLESPSSRTGQPLRVGRAFLQEQLDEPEAHDLATLAARVTCPVLIVHGASDPTVPPACAEELGRAIGAEATVAIIEGADHVFNTPNPMVPGQPPSPQLQRLVDLMREFVDRVV
jgi:pimeloyl-ACP methyl ester carboxylesterase